MNTKYYLRQLLTTFLILLSTSLIALAFKSEGSAFSSDKSLRNPTGFVSDKEGYNSSEGIFDGDNDPILATVAGIPFRKFEDLEGIRIGFMPLVLTPGATMIFSAFIEDFLGDNPPIITASLGTNGSLSTRWVSTPSEMTLKMIDHTEGMATTDPGVKEIKCVISWFPRSISGFTSNQIKMKIFWTVESDTVNPKNGKFFDDFGVSDFILQFTSLTGGTFICEEHDRGRSIPKNFVIFGTKGKIEGYRFRGNFTLGFPGERLPYWGLTPKYGYNAGEEVFQTAGAYLDSFGDRKVPAKTKPSPINEAFFNKESITGVSLENGKTFQITTLEQYEAARFDVVYGNTYLTRSTACRLIEFYAGNSAELKAFRAGNGITPLSPGINAESCQFDDHVDDLNYPVINPIDESYTLVFKLRRRQNDRN